MLRRILSILTRTPLHVGAGSSVGAIDLPVQRERHTQIPIIPGSGLKGVLRDLWNEQPEDQTRLFGPESDAPEHAAGELLVGEARALCFPVRSARGSFAWIACPLVLHRYASECGHTWDLPEPTEDTCLAPDAVCINGSVVLEEYAFKAGHLPEETPSFLKDFIPGDPVLESLPRRMVLVSDGIYSHFCANACEVQQRIQIDDQTGVVKQGALFNQENVPSETLFYGMVGARKDPASLNKLDQKLRENGNILQIGGDGTVGLGYCSVSLQGGVQ
ncbi:MAG: type III-B CRISPR module RAMP protein Cmr4 [Acidobacteriota bacterium]